MTITVPNTDRDRWFIGTLLRIVADGTDTAGGLAIMEQQARRGFSPPRHVHHREDSALLVLDGAITVVIGDERRQVGAGEFVWLPRDVPHTFRVDSDTVRQLELVTPAGFEQYHLETSDAAP
ncbi:MAG: cupin domain-containing protein, partial [Actinobacteria bacterium]|nr:cupin domain-containing protein [Actinomycetota bacterium]MBI3257161.1 cupin domain-containing protein [Actinomycetota bacterium]